MLKQLSLALAGAFTAASAWAAPAPTKIQHPDWSRNAVIYEVNLRQGTDAGTAKAFQEQLPRLQDLGVDILWFMPINPISQKDRKGTLGSYYAVQDYKKFNPEFGTLQDFKALVDDAHARGMKVILDWVPNHTGRDNVWVSEHPEYYRKNDKGEMVGIYDWTDVYCLNYNNPATCEAMVDAMKFWLTEVGVDGFRCDVAMEVPVDFWNWARPKLQAVKPDLFMLAEAAQPDLQEKCFDMGYNWPMAHLFSAIAATQGQYTFADKEGNVKKFPETHATAIDSLLNEQANAFPADSYLMNMITNHDFNSWEGTEFQRLGILAPAFAVLTYTLPGMPLIYTGQETGMNRAFEFFEKDKAPQWEPRNEYFKFYQTLDKVKHNSPALRAGIEGGEMHTYPTASPDVYAFSRTKDGKTVFVMVNLSNKPQRVKFTGETPNIKGLTNPFTGKKVKLSKTLTPGQYILAL